MIHKTEETLHIGKGYQILHVPAEKGVFLESIDYHAGRERIPEQAVEKMSRRYKDNPECIANDPEITISAKSKSKRHFPMGTTLFAAGILIGIAVSFIMPKILVRKREKSELSE